MQRWLVAILMSLGLAGFASAQDLTQMDGKQIWDVAETQRNAGNDHGALQTYQYLVDHHPEDQIYAPLALYRICMVHYNLREIDEAEKYIRQMMEQYPESNACAGGYGLFYLSAIELVFRRGDGDARYLREMLPYCEKWTSRMQSWEWAAALARTAAIYLRHGQPQEGLEFLQTYLPHCPRLLLDCGDFWPNTVDCYLAMHDEAGARAAARQAFALCDYTDAAVKQAVELVRKGYGTNGPGVPRVLPGQPQDSAPIPPPPSNEMMAFLIAQDDPEARNPLAEVALPSIAPEYKQQLLAGAGNDPLMQALVYAYCGDCPAALAMLQSALEAPALADPTKLLKMTCRVLKATDLNLVRANQLAQYLTQGDVQSPLEFPLPALPTDAAAQFKPIHIAGKALASVSKWKRMIDTKEISAEGFPGWAAAQKITPEMLVLALAATPATYRMDGIYLPLCDALWQMKPTVADHLKDPPGVKVKLAIWLGLHEKPDESRAMMRALTEEEASTPSDTAYYVYASEVREDGKTGTRLAIWGYEQGANRRGPSDQAWISAFVAGLAGSLDDPQVVTDDLIPWTLAAFARPGAESRWASSVYAIVWAYSYLKQPEKALEQGEYWVEEGRKRKISQEEELHSILQIARQEASMGRRQEAEKRINDFIAPLPQDSRLRQSAKWMLQQIQKPAGRPE